MHFYIAYNQPSEENLVLGFTASTLAFRNHASVTPAVKQVFKDYFGGWTLYPEILRFSDFCSQRYSDDTWRT